MSIIQVTGLSKYYGKKLGVKDIDLSVEPGERFGFIGPNGAGKSTTIRMIMQLLRPTGGSMKLFGKRPAQDDPELRRRIGYLPSEVHYDSDMTGKQLLQFAARSYGMELSKTRAIEYSERLALDLSRRVRDYSLGNRKKLGIIQCLLHQPELVILDEPTSGLDPLVQHEFFDLLNELNEQGMTVFFSTHVLSEIERFCGRVAFIRSGELLRVSTLDGIPEMHLRRFIVTFREPGDLTDKLELRRLDPAVRYERGEHILEVSGGMDRMLYVLHSAGVADLRIERPTLEQIFMKDYTGFKEGGEV